MRQNQTLHTLDVVQDGISAMAFLRKETAYADVSRPDLILLDLNLPGKNGFDVLRDLKADDRFKQIPIVVLTSSEAQEDINRSYDLHANCFLTKPWDLDQFVAMISGLIKFWFSSVRLPVMVP